ncbi:MAG TPA: hypothetical protein P5205_09980 [Candidatus Paceibacterota bacterium]|nr:hypothetical protein [Candidatus Paceibacterota bacterium]
MLHSGNKMERTWFRLAPRWWYRRFPVGGYQFDRKDRAMWALRTLGRPGHPATPDLLAILEDTTEHWNQRYGALTTLRAVEADPAILIPVMEKLTNDAVVGRFAVAEVQTLRRNLERQREWETQRALAASLSARREPSSPDFHASTSWLGRVSLYGSEKRGDERSLGSKGVLPRPNGTGSSATNASIHDSGLEQK